MRNNANEGEKRESQKRKNANKSIITPNEMRITLSAWPRSGDPFILNDVILM